MNIKCLAVDDEPLALEMVCNFIRQTPSLELAAQFDNGIDALHFLESNTVQLIFLDIQMADLTGMQLARILSSNNHPVKPFIIFTTAYSEFALEGYKVDAVDYILKPFDYEDFLKAVSRVKNRIREQPEKNTTLSTPSQPYIFLKVGSQSVKVDTSDILYVESFKDYIKIHLQSRPTPLLSLMSLKAMEDKLAGNEFIRIHRSYIVSIARIDSLLKTQVKVAGEIIPVGAKYKEAYEQFMNAWLK